MVRYRQYNPAHNRYFKCRASGCAAVCCYNLQEMSQKTFVVVLCKKCSKEWEVRESHNNKSCCGRMVVKITSIEKNISARPISFTQSVHKS